MLRRPYTKVTTFQDRPGRLGGLQSLSGLISAWDGAFGGVPPNAALRDRPRAAGTRHRPPRAREASAQPGEGHAHLRRRLLDETRNVHLRTLAREADPSVARRFGRATLFIDDAAAVFGYAVEFNLFGRPRRAPTSTSR